MKKLLLSSLLLILLSSSTVLAAPTTPISPPLDLPPGAMNFDSTPTNNGIDPNIAAAIIGVAGLLIGSALTILGTYFLRYLDIRREDKKEERNMVNEKREKEFQIKQEIYKNFLTELGTLESFLLHLKERVELKDNESFRGEWTKMEIKMSLVCGTKMRDLLNAIQDELLTIAKKRFAGGSVELGANYLKKREGLLEAIRKDIDIFQNQ